MTVFGGSESIFEYLKSPGEALSAKSIWLRGFQPGSGLIRSRRGPGGPRTSREYRDDKLEYKRLG